MQNYYHTLINHNELQDKLDTPDQVIVDCRYDLMNPDAGFESYLSGHIPGAVYANVHSDLSGPPLTDNGRHPLPSETHLLSLFRRLGINNDSQVIVYDTTAGAFAARLWWLLRFMGHTRVALLNGGLVAWENAGHELETGNNTNQPGIFSGTANMDWLVRVQDIPSQHLLIDSRDAERYRGDIEPIDKSAGHIPGAINRPWKTNLDEKGYFKSPDKLHEEFEQLCSGQPPASAVYYCGSGVTACHNILASVHADFAMPRLYAGSWSDWCSDPTRPVMTGEDPGILQFDGL